MIVSFTPRRLQLIAKRVYWKKKKNKTGSEGRNNIAQHIRAGILRAIQLNLGSNYGSYTIDSPFTCDTRASHENTEGTLYGKIKLNPKRAPTVPVGTEVLRVVVPFVCPCTVHRDERCLLGSENGIDTNVTRDRSSQLFYCSWRELSIWMREIILNGLGPHTDIDSIFGILIVPKHINRPDGRNTDGVERSCSHS